MQPLSVIKISSTFYLWELYENLKTLNRNSPGYEGEMIICPEEGYNEFPLVGADVSRLFKILAKLRCRKLSLARVAQSYSPMAKLNLLRHLLEVELTMCSSNLTFITAVVANSPNLVRLSEIGTEKLPIRNRTAYDAGRMLEIIEPMINTIQDNYRLLDFESPSFEGELKVLIQAGIQANQRTLLKSYLKSMKLTLKRNHDGYANCSAAIRQLFLIKRHCPDSLFRFINRDVVMIIAKLVHQSRGTKVWSR